MYIYTHNIYIYHIHIDRSASTLMGNNKQKKKYYIEHQIVLSAMCLYSPLDQELLENKDCVLLMQIPRTEVLFLEQSRYLVNTGYGWVDGQTDGETNK